jgi:hypothetical protein
MVAVTVPAPRPRAQPARTTPGAAAAPPAPGRRGPEETVPTLGADYELQIERIVYAPGETVAFAQLIEHLEVKGVMTDIPETIIFDLNDEGLIRRMSLYLKQPGGPAPDGGKDATGATQG